MFEKYSILRSLKNSVKKEVMIETEKINNLLPNISTDNITELNELINAGSKLTRDKNGIPLRMRISYRNTKRGWEIRLEGLENKLWE